MLPGEIALTEEDGSIECDCGAILPMRVLKSNNYYIGHRCRNCGPVDRQSGYYATEAEAQKALDDNTYYRI